MEMSVSRIMTVMHTVVVQQVICLSRHCLKTLSLRTSSFTASTWLTGHHLMKLFAWSFLHVLLAQHCYFAQELCDILRSVCLTVCMHDCMPDHLHITTRSSAMLVNSYHVSRGMGVRKVSNSKRDLQRHSRALAMVPLDRPHTVSY